MSNEELLEYFERNELVYDNFREAAKAIYFDFPHDLFDNLAVQCLYCTPQTISTLRKMRIGEKFYGAFVHGRGASDIVIVNIDAMVKYRVNDIYQRIKDVLVHEYLHAFCHHHKLMSKEVGRGQTISKKLAKIRKAYKKSYSYDDVVADSFRSYERRYKGHIDILNEEFMIQAYTTRFNGHMDILGTRTFEQIREVMMEVHPYFERANMPKHLANKIKQITF